MFFHLTSHSVSSSHRTRFRFLYFPVCVGQGGTSLGGKQADVFFLLQDDWTHLKRFIKAPFLKKNNTFVTH